MQLKTMAIGITLAGALAACGDTVGEQALIGGAVGAGTAVVTDGSLAQGAAIGAAGNLLYCQAYPRQCN
jgi:hypothetical protein